MLLRNLLDQVMLQQWWRVHGMLNVQFEKRGRAKRGVGGDVDVRALHVLDQRWLHEVRVMLDL